jgi:hypothetical protein
MRSDLEADGYLFVPRLFGLDERRGIEVNMKAFAVEYPLHKPGVTILHYKLFNGQQASGAGFRAGSAFFGDSEKRPLRIRHNIRQIPDVFVTVNLPVISRRVRDALGELPFVEYRPVSFPAPVDVPVPALGDTSWEGYPGLKKAEKKRDWPSNLFDYLPAAQPEQCKDLKDYYEMIVPRLKEAAAEFPEAREIVIPEPYTIDKQNKLRVCPALLEKYPVFWWGQTVFAEWAFRPIEPFLDRGYAEVVEFEV